MLCNDCKRQVKLLSSDRTKCINNFVHFVRIPRQWRFRWHAVIHDITRNTRRTGPSHILTSRLGELQFVSSWKYEFSSVHIAKAEQNSLFSPQFRGGHNHGDRSRMSCFTRGKDDNRTKGMSYFIRTFTKDGFFFLFHWPAWPLTICRFIIAFDMAYMRYCYVVLIHRNVSSIILHTLWF